MTFPTTARRLRASAVLAGTLAAPLALTACTAAPPASAPSPADPDVPAPAVIGDGSLEGMRILLTNDDSVQASRENNSDGLGLYLLRAALCEAGADVVVVGPWQVQSGRGTAVTNSGELTLAAPLALPAEHAADCAGAPSGGPVLGVCLGAGACAPDSPSATPVDTVKLALRGGLAAVAGWDELPDLVITGPNAGLNVSSSVNDSGTLGAAVAAVENGVPALALSASADPTFAYHPVENYAAVSTWAVELVQGLAARDLLLQHDFVLSVNYPDVSTGTVPGAPRWVQVGTGAVAYHTYTPVEGSTFEVAVGLCDGLALCAESRADADAVTVLQDGAIAVGAIDPDRTYEAERDGLDVLAAIRQYVESDAPDPVA